MSSTCFLCSLCEMWYTQNLYNNTRLFCFVVNFVYLQFQLVKILLLTPLEPEPTACLHYPFG